MQRLMNLIFFRILRTTFYSTIALTFCIWIVRSSKYLGILNTSGISLSKYIKFTSYLSVDIVATILPISLAISAAFVFQRFKESNQLIALQSTGASPNMLLKPLFLLSSIVTCYLLVSNAYISPNAWIRFLELEFSIKNNIDPPENSGVIFSKNGFSVYAQNYKGDFSFENLFIIDERNANKKCTYFAKVGTIKNNILFLMDGEIIEIDFRYHKNSVTRFASYKYDLSELLTSKKRQSKLNEKFPNELLNFDGKTREEITEQKALLHQKITAPILTIVYVLLAFFLILLASYSRRINNLKIWIFISAIIIIQGVYFWIASASTKQLMFVNLNYIFLLTFILTLAILIFIKRRL